MLSKFKHNFKIFKKIDHYKNILLKKKLNKLILFIKKKGSTFFSSHNRNLLFVFGVFFIILSYLSVPYFYNTTKLIYKIETELSKNLNINFKLSKNFNYSFFPTPNFTFEEVSLLNESNNSGKIKVDILISKLLFYENIEIKDIVLSNVNFNFNKQNYDLFTKLLKNDYSNFKFEIKNSNIFYRTIKNDVLFINKVDYLKYYYDKKKLSNFLIADNEIFNLLYSIKYKNDFVNKKITTIVDSRSLNLKIENDLDYKNSEKKGLMTFFYNKTKSNVKYSYNEDFFEFNFSEKSLDPNFIYKGTINLKPFFSESSGIFKKINSKDFLNPNSILLQFLKTEILNNKNLNMSTSLNAKQIDKFEDLVDFILKVKISEGLIDINETSISWLDTVDFKISDSLIHMNNNNLVLDALIKIQINNYNELYKFFQTPRNYRREIKKVQFNLRYNFDQYTANLDDIKIDGLIDQNINKTLKQLNIRDNKLKNRIYFKNLINQAIKLYAG